LRPAEPIISIDDVSRGIRRKYAAFAAILV
jgi:hypothetical protein